MRTPTATLTTYLMVTCASAYAASTEYAVRWDPDKSPSAPQTAAAAAAQFGIQDAKAKTTKVQYLDVKQPATLPGPDVRVVGRERTDADGLPEAMYKVRGTNAGAVPSALAAWTCPLKGNPKPKLEIDVSWVSDPEEAKAPTKEREALSYSCSVDGPASAAFPPELAATLVPCSSQVSRLKQEDKAKKTAWKVEEWKLPGGARLVELSYSVPEGSAAHKAAFKKHVDALAKDGAVLLPAKTVLGSTCPK